jgi:hypothetical protein
MTVHELDDQRRPRHLMARATVDRVRARANTHAPVKLRAAAVLVAALLSLGGCGWVWDAFFADEPLPDPPFAVHNELDAAIERWSKRDYGIPHDKVREDSITFLRQRFPPGSKTRDVLDYFSEIGGACTPGPDAITYVCEYCRVKIKGTLDPVYKSALYRRFEYLWRLRISGTPPAETDGERTAQMSLRMGVGGSNHPPDWNFEGGLMDCPSARRRLDNPAFGPDPSAIQPLYLEYDVYEQTLH